MLRSNTMVESDDAGESGLEAAVRRLLASRWVRATVSALSNAGMSSSAGRADLEEQESIFADLRAALERGTATSRCGHEADVCGVVRACNREKAHPGPHERRDENGEMRQGWWGDAPAQAEASALAPSEDAAWTEREAKLAAIEARVEALRTGWRVLVNDDGEPYAVDNGTSLLGVQADASWPGRANRRAIVPSKARARDEARVTAPSESNPSQPAPLAKDEAASLPSANLVKAAEAVVESWARADRADVFRVHIARLEGALIDETAKAPSGTDCPLGCAPGDHGVGYRKHCPKARLDADETASDYDRARALAEQWADVFGADVPARINLTRRVATLLGDVRRETIQACAAELHRCGEWKAWARVIHESYRARVRQTLRAIKWAKKPLTGAELAAKHGFEPIPEWKRDPVARPMQSAASGDASKEET